MAYIKEVNNDYSEIFPIEGKEGKRNFGALEERTVVTKMASAVMGKAIPFMLVGSVMMGVTGGIIPDFISSPSNQTPPQIEIDNPPVVIDNEPEENKENNIEENRETEVQDPVIIENENVIYVPVPNPATTPDTPSLDENPTPTESPTPAPTETPVPTETPSPTETPAPDFTIPELGLNASINNVEQVNESDELVMYGTFKLDGTVILNDAKEVTLKSVNLKYPTGTITDITADCVTTGTTLAYNGSRVRLNPNSEYTFEVEYEYYQDDTVQALFGSTNVTAPSFVIPGQPVISINGSFETDSISNGLISGRFKYDGSTVFNDATEIKFTEAYIMAGNEQIDFTDDISIDANGNITAINTRGISLSNLNSNTEYTAIFKGQYLSDDSYYDFNEINVTFNTPSLPDVAVNPSFDAATYNAGSLEGNLALELTVANNDASNLVVDSKNITISDGNNEFNLSALMTSDNDNVKTYSGFSANAFEIFSGTIYTIKVPYSYEIVTENSNITCNDISSTTLIPVSPISIGTLTYSAYREESANGGYITLYLSGDFNDLQIASYDFVYRLYMTTTESVINFTKKVTVENNSFSFTGIPQSDANEEMAVPPGTYGNIVEIRITTADDKNYTYISETQDVTVN